MRRTVSKTKLSIVLVGTKLSIVLVGTTKALAESPPRGAVTVSLVRTPFEISIARPAAAGCQSEQAVPPRTRTACINISQHGHLSFS